MSIHLPEELPATRVLRQEGIEVAAQGPAGTASGPTLRVALLNLMPEKAATETQFARLLGATPHAVELTLLRPGSHRPKPGTSPEATAHLARFYRTWDAVRAQTFDGLIVTGAPLETLAFEAVDYWDELTEIFDWAETHVGFSYFICWAAQAALYHRHGVPKRLLTEKCFGIFRHQPRRPEQGILWGLGDEVPVPVSRHSETWTRDLPADGRVSVLLESSDSGPGLLSEHGGRSLYMLNHLEYERDTLRREYERDRQAGRPVPVPRNYFRGDDPAAEPLHTWRAHAEVLFRNWLGMMAKPGAATAPDTPGLDWLLARPARHEARQSGATDFLILQPPGRDSLPEVLAHLAGFGLSPDALRVQVGKGAERWVELRIATADAALGERVSQSLLRCGAARQVSYRQSGGRGGRFVALDAAA